MQRAAAALVFALLLDGEGEVRTPRPVLSSLLAIARDERGDANRREARAVAEIERIADLVKKAMRDAPDRPPVTVLNETVFGTLGFAREVDDTDLRFVLLPSVLEMRRGSCVGLGTLYLALGEALGWPASGVMVPGHFFVRMNERAKTRNVELLRRGEEMPDTWYAARFPFPSSGAREYARALTPSEVLGVIEYDIGNDRRRRERLVDARHAFESATRDFPSFSEAHASLGATLHLLGALDQAEASYLTAKRANPDLPGLEANLDLLREERAATPR